jgi:hypothetical protein
MKVFVYWNLHKNLWSVKCLEGPNKGRVIARLAFVKLRDCVFKVSESGRQRVLKTKTKNVHAGVIGYLTDTIPKKLNKTATYNPYKYSSFVNRKTLKPVTKSDFVMLDSNRAVNYK